MRLHRLRLSAFGPFAGTEELDLDALAAGGLFLLHGPTGAGKSSVLDAICFALYGRLPGSRAGTARIRSDHAPPDAVPEVLCELTAGGRRLEVTRSPAWERPRRRGGGTTTAPARVLVREHVHGDWVPRTSRADEAAQLLDDALGMGADQFTTVVMLPQGEFAAFLRARADERRPMLQRLFDTGRYAAAESGLAERARALGDRVARADASLDRLLARAHEAAGEAGARDRGPTTPTTTQDPEERVGAMRATARAGAAAARTRHVAAREALRAARGRHDGLRELVDLLRRHGDTVARVDRLAADAGRVEALERRLAAARAAEGLRGHLEVLTDAEREAAAAGRQRDAAVLRAAGLAAPGSAADPAALREEAGRLGAMLDDEAELGRLQARARGAERRRAAARAAAEDAASRAGLARAAETDRRLRVEALAVVAAGVAAAQDAERRAALVAAAAGDLPGLEALAADAERRERAAVDAEQAARAAWLDLRERRLAGVAGELAAVLAAGAPCPVCGSAEHPRPAPPAEAGVSAAAEEAAHRQYDRAAEERGSAQVAAAGARERCGEVRARAEGLDAGAATRRHRAARDALERARAASAELGRARAAAEEAVGAVAAADREAGEAEAAEAVAVAEGQAARTRADALDRRLAAARGADASLRARRDRLTALATALEEVEVAGADAARTAAAAARARDAAADAAAAAGLRGLSDARAALVPAEGIRALAEELRRHHDATAAAAAACEDAAARLAERRTALGLLDDAADGPVEAQLAGAREVLAAAGADLAAAEASADAAARACAVAERAVAALDDLHAHVAADVAAAAPLRAEHARVADLAACAAGSGGGNALRMPLPAFVLAARLEQVAAAATVRLEQVSGGRFALRHSDAAERNRRKSGLGLVVADAWTGVDRDPATLSGGEAFMASLALALGLADVVQAECGGGAIETLFVDEGFGSLDEDSLEEVLDVLDGLREGGRAVGVVSHVAELRARVPARVEVLKTPAGSSLRVRPGAA